MIAPFTVLGGATDYLLGAVVYGAQGAITGSANIAPRVCIKVFELASTGQAEKASSLAMEISRGEWALGKGNILGTKVSLKSHIQTCVLRHTGRMLTSCSTPRYSPTTTQRPRPCAEGLYLKYLVLLVNTFKPNVPISSL